MKTTARSFPEPSDAASADGSGLRANPDRTTRFEHPRTRMLLDSDDFTMPILESILGTELRVRVLRQDELTAAQLPAIVTDVLRISGDDLAIVRHSCLIGPDMVTASVNYVVGVSGPSATTGVDDVRTPIGYSLITREVAQRRRILRTGVSTWPDGRPCAAKAYVILLDDRPLCYIRETFNPDVIAVDGPLREQDTDWSDKPLTVDSDSAMQNASRVLDASRSEHDTTAHARDTRRRPLTGDLAEVARGGAIALHVDGGAMSTARGSRTRAIHRSMTQAAAAVLAYGSGQPIVVIDASSPDAESAPVPGQLVSDDPGGNGLGRATTRLPDSGQLPRAYRRPLSAFETRRAPEPQTSSAQDILRQVADQRDEHPFSDLLRTVSALLPTATVAPPAARAIYSSSPRQYFSRAMPRASDIRTDDRRDPADDKPDEPTLLWLDSSARAITGGDSELPASVVDPVAVVLAASATPREVDLLCDRWNPGREPGKLTLVPRLGSDVHERLPALFEAATRGAAPVVWLCDPVRDISTMSEDDAMDDIADAVRTFVQLCRDTGTVFGGLHLRTAPVGVADNRVRAGLRHDVEHRSGHRRGLDPEQMLRCVLTVLTELSTA